MIGIFAQFIVDDRVIAGFQVYDDAGNVLKSDSNLLGGNELLLRNVQEIAAHIRLIYILVSDIFYEENHRVFENLSQRTKVFRVNSPELKSKLHIQTQEYRDTHQFLVILYEKIFQQNLSNLEHRSYQQKLDILHAIIHHTDFRKYIDKSDEFQFHSKVEEFFQYLEKNVIEHPLTKLDLNDEQKRVFQTFYDFVKTDGPAIMLLIGSAGTGKSTLISYLSIFYRFLTEYYGILLLAPTGKAARVIEMKTQMKCSTLHRAIYSYKRELKYEKRDNEEYVRMQEIQELSNDIFSYPLCIVDEASMLSDFVTREELEHSLRMQASYKTYINCTGYMIYDLIQYMKKRYKNYKIIFVGDNCQLSPINAIRTSEDFIPALEIDFLRNKYSDVHFFVANLSKAYRFASDEIYHFSLFLRDKIYGKSKEYLYTTIKDLFIQFSAQQYSKNNSDIFLHDELESFLKKYDECFSIDKKNAIIITHRNQSADYLNKCVRNRFGYQNPLSTKDLCIATRNNYFYDIMNGELFIAKELTNIILQAVEYPRLKVVYIIPFYKANVEMVHHDKEKQNIILLQERDDNHARLRSVDIKEYSQNIPDPVEEQRRLFQYFQMQSARKKFEQIVDQYARLIIKQRTSSDTVDVEEDSSGIQKIVLFEHGKVKNFLEKYIQNHQIDSYEQFEMFHLKQCTDLQVMEVKEIFNAFLDAEYNINPFFNPVFFRHGYAITCHKAQGSEWENVFLTDVKNNDFRWIYTAVTRGKSRLHILPFFQLRSVTDFEYDFYFLSKDFRGIILEVQQINRTTVDNVTEVIAGYLKYEKDLVQIGDLEPQALEEDLYVLQTSRNNIFFVECSRVPHAIISQFQNGIMHNIKFEKIKDDGWSVATWIEFSYS